ncbi:hypothetical protein CHS0354_037273 [Potamilus streckersoni]|uniref:CARD domain-containing protein n=1 Tax=Potamilus streckersoni TaxID=2493646 RepID=A0AAE0SXD0_9BIVA|nr:hypothetical protein CHS0354_037273 [Potamilus streckersoni]
MECAEMDYDTITLSSFHKTKGDNILTTEDTATWNPVANGAITFSKEPLRSDVPVIFEMEGTGRISLGIIHFDPKNLKGRPLYKLQDMPEYIEINEIRFHKQKCSIKSTLEPGGERVVTNFIGKKFTQRIRPVTNVWLAVCVKYGEVTLRLISEAAVHYTPILSEVIGMNLEFCGNGKNEVRTVSSNPAALCFLSKPLNIGQKMSFFCKPLTDDQGVAARQFYLKIKIINKEPRQLQQQYPYIFTVTATQRSEPNWVCSVNMDMKECNGQLSVERSVDRITFSNAMNERTKESKYTDQSSELWVALELYRVSVRQIVFCTLTMNIVDDAVEYSTPVDAVEYLTPDNAVEYSTPDDAVGYLTPDNAVEYLTPDNAVGYLTPEDAVGYQTPDDAVGYLTPEDAVGYPTPLSLPLARKLKSEERNNPKDTLPPPKPHQSRKKGLSMPSYAIVDGNKSNLEDGALSAYPSKSVEDNVRFEASFNGYFSELVSDLSASELCDHLLSLNLMTEGEYDTIISKDSSYDQNRELLRHLRRRSVPRLQFEAALKKTGNGHLVPMFFCNKPQ